MCRGAAALRRSRKLIYNFVTGLGVVKEFKKIKKKVAFVDKVWLIVSNTTLRNVVFYHNLRLLV